MPNPGTIYGTHHLTFCVGTAQEDYDFHVRHARPEEHQEDGPVRRRHPRLPPLLRQPCSATGARCSPPSRPARRAGAAGAGPTSCARSTCPCRPARSADWVDRLREAGYRGGGARPVRHTAALLRGPCAGSRTRSWARRSPTTGSRGTTAACPASTRSAAPTALRPRCASPSRWTSSSRTRSTARSSAPRGAEPPGRRRPRLRAQARAGRGARPAAGPRGFGEGTIHHHAFDAGSSENQARR